MWMFFPIYEWSSTWSGDIFPIIHGGYFTGDDGTIQSYNFWNIMYAEIVDFSLFSNGDFFYLYWINVNNIQFNDSFNLDSTGLLMRIDATIGRTIWAKDIIFVINYAILRIYVCTLKDNLIWWLVTIYGYSNYYGIITQVDFDGNIIMSFSIVNRVNAPKSDIKFLIPEFLSVDDDNSIILWSETTFYQNEMGVSSNSQVDISILKFDRSQNIEWSTSIDYGNLIDHASSSNIFNRNIYVFF